MFGLLSFAGRVFRLSILLAGSAFQLQAQRIPILVYHRFSPDISAETTIRTSRFEAHLRWLASHNIRIVPLHQAVAMLCAGQPERRSFAVLTVDDGHRSVYSELFPILQRNHIPVTLFLYPSAISNASYALTWQQLRQMQRSGLVDVQSHTLWHPDFRREKARLSDGAYRAFVAKQLNRSRAILEQQLGAPVDLLAWPFGIADAALEDAARQAGYKAAFLYSGGAARPGVSCFALARIPVPPNASDAWFEQIFGKEVHTP